MKTLNFRLLSVARQERHISDFQACSHVLLVQLSLSGRRKRSWSGTKLVVFTLQPLNTPKFGK